MKIECHNRKLKTNEYKVITTIGKEYGYLSEFITEAICSVCDTLIIMHEWITFDGKHQSQEYKGRKATRFQKKIRQKEALYKETQVDKRMYLKYNEYGNENKKCYSNLSTLKIGLIDPDEGLRDFQAA